MPGNLDIMHAIREGLDAIHFPSGSEWEGYRTWTKIVLAKLCEIGQGKFGYCVCTNKNHAPSAQGSEWLYDMTWIEHDSEERMVSVPLVVECEWSTGIENIEEDFQKLLLPREGVRLMICYEGDQNQDADDLANGLAKHVQRFHGIRDEDAYLLAVLRWEDETFNYFRLGLNGVAAWGGS